MKELIDLLSQIQDLAGVGIDALQQATGEGSSEGPPKSAPPGEGSAPPEPPAQG